MSMNDEILLKLASQHESIEDFLDTIFGFFSRKTDLYHVMTSESDNRGFAPGRAEALVLSSFRRRGGDSPSSSVDSRHAIKLSQDNAVSDKSSASVSSGISTWNGGVTSKYRWSQAISELTVEVPVDAKISSSKEVSVQLTSTKLEIKLNGQLLLSGTFHDRINASESTWTVEDQSRILLSLEKSKESWWKSVLTGDEEIDTTKVESTKRIEEYDEVTQGAIRKIMFDQNQKRQGLLTSDEASMADKLKSAWNVDGSPFKGTEFDPNFVRQIRPSE